MTHTREFLSGIRIIPALILALLLLFATPTLALAVSADAGVDQVVRDGELAIMDGVNSTGASLSFVWTEDGSVLSTDESFSKKFTIGVHTIALNVTDDVNDTDTDSVTVTVNDMPHADAGGDRTVTKGVTVTFDASSSIDDVGGIVSYEWNEEGTVLSTSKKFNKKFSDGIHPITLKVTDKYAEYDSDTIKITVSAPPVANAGPDRLVYEGTRILLNGTNSTDSDGHIVSYKWADGSEIYNTAQAFEKVFPIGVHTIALTVTDNDGATGTDSVTIEVLKLDKAPPIADAGTDIVVGVGESVLLNASGSSDRDGNIVSYLWLEDDILSNSVSFEKIFDVGKHTITLTVTDNDNLEGSDNVIVTVLAPNVAPVAKAGDDFNVAYGDYVHLDASQSSDTDGSIVLYGWRENGKLLGSNASLRSKMDVGVHHIELTVTDNSGELSTDNVIVTVYLPPSKSQNNSDKTGIPFVLIFVVITLLFLAVVSVILISLKKYGGGTSNSSQIRRQRRPDIKPIKMRPKPPVRKRTGDMDEGTANNTRVDGRDIKQFAHLPDTLKRTGRHGENTLNRPANIQENSQNDVSTTPMKPSGQDKDRTIDVTINIIDPNIDPSIDPPINSTTGLPIENATVSIGSATHTTDKKGNVVFREMPDDTLTITTTARLYKDCTKTMKSSPMIQIGLVPLPLLSSRHERAISDIKKGIDESYRSIMTYDRCIPSFYKSIVHNNIKLMQTMRANQFSQSDIEPEDVIDSLIAKTGIISQRISQAMTSKRIIDIYTASSDSIECIASDIDTDRIKHLVTDPSGYYASGYLTVQRRLSDVDSQITLMSRKMSVIPLSSLLKIAKEMLECDDKTQLERAICVFDADNLLDHIIEMYNNEHIVSRLKLGVL